MGKSPERDRPRKRFSLPKGFLGSSPTASQQKDLHSLKQDQEVKRNRHVFDVEQVISQLLSIVFDRRTIRSVDLRPPRCSWLYVPALAIKRDGSPQLQLLVRHERPGSNEVHVAEQNVIELWKFVETRTSQKAAHPRNTIVLHLGWCMVLTRIGAVKH